MSVVGGDQFVNQPFGVNPARRVRADAELAGVVGNHDGLAQRPLQQPLMTDRAPQRGFAGDLDGIGRDFYSRQTAFPSDRIPVRPGASRQCSHS